MKITTTPEWNHERKTVTLQLTDEQYAALKRTDFKATWYILRLKV